MYRKTKMGVFLMYNEAAAAQALLKVFEKCGGSPTRVSEHYEVGLTTVKRWVRRLEEKGYGVREKIRLMREAATS